MGSLVEGKEMEWRILAIGCALLLGSIAETKQSFAQAQQILYHGCVVTTVDRARDGFDNDDDEFFGDPTLGQAPLEVAVWVDASFSPEDASFTPQEDFNLVVGRWLDPEEEHDGNNKAGEIQIVSALSADTLPDIPDCEPADNVNPLGYWELQRDEPDICEELLTDVFDADAHNVCGSLVDDHLEEGCNFNVVYSTIIDNPLFEPEDVLGLSIEVGAMLYGNIELFTEHAGGSDPGQVDLVIEGLLPDGSSSGLPFRSEIRADRSFEGESPTCLDGEN